MVPLKLSAQTKQPLSKSSKHPRLLSNKHASSSTPPSVGQRRHSSPLAPATKVHSGGGSHASAGSPGAASQLVRSQSTRPTKPLPSPHTTHVCSLYCSRPQDSRG